MYIQPMKRISTLMAAVAAVIFIGLGTASASDTDHTLTVDGQQYQSYKEAGESIHWDTPDSNPTSASFPERLQSWSAAAQNHGFEHLPCPYGIHWISNENVLTISHCLDGPAPTTTTVVGDTTTTVVDDTTTTVDETTTTVADTTTTTVVDTTTTDSTQTTAAVTFTSDIGTPLAPTHLPRTGFPIGLFLLAACAITALGGIFYSLRHERQ